MAINAIYSATAFEFKTSRELIFGVLEASYGLGFTLGPLVGQVIYAHYGFARCFLILSWILIFPMILILFMKFEKESSENLTRDGPSHREELTYKRLLGVKRNQVTLAVIVSCIICMMFYGPLLSNQLASMNIAINKIGKNSAIRHPLGYFFLFGTLSYVVFGPIVGILSKRYEEKRYLTFAALLITALGLMFFGPSELLKMP
jgi:MFS family permease